ncbi:uncharacterized protein BCR38DRAFT_483251 [Pseudomassariella vexata]|uniref:Uncharacterized protein n=1 Tax=Pseudomassariella vexata TaxID=1141098 RepID=A0A1Y2E879_9PEZI|nr:uncharacterized protein BCR38DRAFT_483251 [Pseudomassariella vexata]ORY67637.1 hypothetical protein BCR38DRAFT_483251 [Pseudomassariella vexata]
MRNATNSLINQRRNVKGWRQLEKFEQDIQKEEAAKLREHEFNREFNTQWKFEFEKRELKAECQALKTEREQLQDNFPLSDIRQKVAEKQTWRRRERFKKTLKAANTKLKEVKNEEKKVKRKRA